MADERRPVAAPAPRGGHQPAEGLDRDAGTEHLSSPSQGVRPEEPTAASEQTADDEAIGGGTGGDEESTSGPAFEPER